MSLKGLEDFVQRKEAEDLLLKTIIGKSLVAVVDSVQSTQKSVSLYDTSCEEAVNLNDYIRQLFEMDYLALPKLEVLYYTICALVRYML